MHQSIQPKMNSTHGSQLSAVGAHTHSFYNLFGWDARKPRRWGRFLPVLLFNRIYTRIVRNVYNTVGVYLAGPLEYIALFATHPN